jgi:O-antigen ligase
MKSFDLKLFQLFFLLLPIALIKGLNYPNIIITLIVVYYLFKNYSQIWNIPFYFKLFFAFFIYLILISLIGETVMFSLHTSFSYLRYGIFILAIPYILNNKKILKILFYVFTILFLIILLDLVYQFIYKKNIFGIPNYNPERISGMFGRREVAGSYAFRLMPVLLFLSCLFIKNNFIYKYLVIILSLGIIFLSGERTSLFLFLLFLLFIIILEKNLKFLTSVIFAALISSLIFIYFMPIQKKRFYDHTINQLAPKNNINKNYYIFSERHQYHFFTSLNMFKENLFFGSGPNSFRYLCDDPKYSVEKIILEKNTVRAKFDGKVTFDKENIYLTDSQKNYTELEINASLIKDGHIFETIVIPKQSKLYISNDFFFKKDDVLFVKYIEHKNGCNTHPHNFLIQILGETGLFGFLFYIYFLYKITFCIIKNLYYLYFKNRRLKSIKYMYLVGATLINFFPFTASGNFFSSWLCIIFSIPLGLLYYLEKNRIS